jgi:hypothetical protein
VLDQFEQYAAERRIRPGVADWATNRDFVTHRVKAEIFNQALGVEKGDAVDIRYQPEVQQALEVLK